MRSSENYIWTQHSRMKMRHYRLTESRVKRVIRHPARLEEGILEGAVAAMQPAEGKRYSEIWTMYVLTKDAVPSAKLFRNTSRPSSDGLAQHSARRSGKAGDHAAAPPDGFEIVLPRPHPISALGMGEGKKIKVITAWRYPGHAPERDPVPPNILQEIKNLL